jgi:hypothetical protein
MCPQAVKTPGVVRGSMPFEIFSSIVSQIAVFPENRSALFYVHVCGEPLLHKEIARCVQFAARAGMRPILTTNATLLTKDKSRQLIEAGLSRIEFSYEGLDAETYERIRIGADFQNVSENIRAFLELNNAAGHPTHTELVIVDLPEVPSEGIREFANRARPHFDSVNVSGYFDWLGRVETIPFARANYQGCSSVDTDMNVLWDGRVVPCCLDVDGAMAIGDFRTQTYLEVISALRRHALRQRLKTGRLEGLPCNACPVPWGGRAVRSASSSQHTLAATTST